MKILLLFVGLSVVAACGKSGKKGVTGDGKCDKEFLERYHATFGFRIVPNAKKPNTPYMIPKGTPELKAKFREDYKGVSCQVPDTAPGREQTINVDTL